MVDRARACQERKLGLEWGLRLKLGDECHIFCQVDVRLDVAKGAEWLKL